MKGMEELKQEFQLFAAVKWNNIGPKAEWTLRKGSETRSLDLNGSAPRKSRLERYSGASLICSYRSIKATEAGAAESGPSAKGRGERNVEAFIRAGDMRPFYR